MASSERHIGRPRSPRFWTRRSGTAELGSAGFFIAAALAVGTLAVAGALFGPASLSLGQLGQAVWEALTGAPPSDQAASAILMQIRLPRVLLGVAVGAGFALSGCALQGLFRNPLADPGLIGVSAGAAVGAVAVIVLGGAVSGGLPLWLRPYLLPLGAFAAASCVTMMVFRMARFGGRLSVAALLLTGVAVNAIAFAVIGALTYISDDTQLRELTFWTMGGLGAANWTSAAVASAAALASGLALLGFARALDLFQLGERAAFHMGLDAERVKTRIGLLAAAAVGAGTAVAGPIGFVGLIAPHIARLLVGPDHARVAPFAALIGAALMLAADLGVRMIAPPAEPPIGLATSLIGGPFFLWLLMRRIGKGGVHA